MDCRSFAVVERGRKGEAAQVEGFDDFSQLCQLLRDFGTDSLGEWREY
jgi:hypothetical protein